MTKFEKRNKYFAEKQSELNSTDEMRYIDGVLCINGVPVTNQYNGQVLIDSVETLFDYIDNYNSKTK